MFTLILLALVAIVVSVRVSVRVSVVVPEVSVSPFALYPRVWKEEFGVIADVCVIYKTADFWDIDDNNDDVLMEEEIMDIYVYEEEEEVVTCDDATQNHMIEDSYVELASAVGYGEALNKFIVDGEIIPCVKTIFDYMVDTKGVESFELRGTCGGDTASDGEDYLDWYMQMDDDYEIEMKRQRQISKTVSNLELSFKANLNTDAWDDSFEFFYSDKTNGKFYMHQGYPSTYSEITEWTFLEQKMAAGVFTSEDNDRYAEMHTIMEQELYIDEQNNRALSDDLMTSSLDDCDLPWL